MVVLIQYTRCNSLLYVEFDSKLSTRYFTDIGQTFPSLLFVHLLSSLLLSDVDWKLLTTSQILERNATI